MAKAIERADVVAAAETKEKKGITVSAANARLKALAKEYGYDSKVYQMASEYIEEHIDDKYIRKKDGHIVNIVAHQGKEVEKEKASFINKAGKEVTQTYKVIEEGVDLKNAFGRSDVFDEYLPTITGLTKKMMDEHSIKGTIKENKEIVKPYANAYAAVKVSYKPTVDDLYAIRDRDPLTLAELDPAEYDRLKGKAQELLDSREKTEAWVEEAKNLYVEYKEKVEEALREEEEQEQN